MPMLPLRALGFLLLTITLSVASCQALFHQADSGPLPEALEQLHD